MPVPAFLSCLPLSHPPLRPAVTQERRPWHSICCANVREAELAGTHLPLLLNPATDSDAVYSVIQGLLALRMPPHPDDPLPLLTDLDGENGSWRAGTSEQCGPAFSMEPVLRSIVLDKNGKPNKRRCVFQLFDSKSGELQNVTACRVKTRSACWYCRWLL